jgi:hypothetical protein
MYSLPYEVPSRRGRGMCWTQAGWRNRPGIGSWQALCPQARRTFLSRGTNSTLLLGEKITGIGEEGKSTTAGKSATAVPYQPAAKGRQQHQQHKHQQDVINIRDPETAKKRAKQQSRTPTAAGVLGAETPE